MNWVHPYFLGYSVMAGTATAALARHRGRRALLWFIFGTIAWFVAVPWLFFTKSRLPDGQAASRRMIPLAVVATCAAIGLNTANVASRPATLPACDSYLGVSDLQDFVAASPAGKVSGLKLLSMTDIREVVRSATEVACNGTGHLNTGAVRMDYSFYFEDGKRLVEAHW